MSDFDCKFCAKRKLLPLLQLFFFSFLFMTVVNLYARIHLDLSGA